MRRRPAGIRRALIRCAPTHPRGSSPRPRSAEPAVRRRPRRKDGCLAARASGWSGRAGRVGRRISVAPTHRGPPKCRNATNPARPVRAGLVWSARPGAHEALSESPQEQVLFDTVPGGGGLRCARAPPLAVASLVV